MKTDTIDYLTHDELKALLSVIDAKRDKAIIMLAYFYGLRASEIGKLRKDDVDFDRMKIRITRVKNSISSEYPLRLEVARSLKSYLRTRADKSPYLFLSKRALPIAPRTLGWLFKRYATAAKLPKDKRHFHVLKHSIATHLLEKTGDVMVVKDWLGHRNIQSTLVYAQLTNKTRDEKVEKALASFKIG